MILHKARLRGSGSRSSTGPIKLVIGAVPSQSAAVIEFIAQFMMAEPAPTCVAVREAPFGLTVAARACQSAGLAEVGLAAQRARPRQRKRGLLGRPP